MRIQIKDRTNIKYGRLTAKYQAGRNKHNQILWFCECSCGRTCVIVGYSLHSGHTESCGCLRKEVLSLTNNTHGKTCTVEYRTWQHMKDRCYNKKNKAYKYYGGRGIIVCPRWLNSFENFLADMRNRPSKNHSIDRIDNDNNYEPDNCKWSTKVEQQSNTRKNKWFYARSPIGRWYKSKNQSAFARKHKLSGAGICTCLSGKHTQHNGWRFW